MVHLNIYKWLNLNFPCMIADNNNKMFNSSESHRRTFTRLVPVSRDRRETRNRAKCDEHTSFPLAERPNRRTHHIFGRCESNWLWCGVYLYLNIFDWLNKRFHHRLNGPSRHPGYDLRTTDGFRFSVVSFRYKLIRVSRVLVAVFGVYGGDDGGGDGGWTRRSQ